MRRLALSAATAALLAIALAGTALGAHPHHLTTPAGCVTLANGGDPGAAYWKNHDTATSPWWALGHGAIHNHVHKDADGSLAAAAEHNPNALMIDACP